MLDQIIKQIAKAARDAAIREMQEQMRTATGTEKLAWMAALVFMGAMSPTQKPTK